MRSSDQLGHYLGQQERCVSYFTLRRFIILMETIKDLHRTPTAIPLNCIGCDISASALRRECHNCFVVAGLRGE